MSEQLYSLCDETGFIHAMGQSWEMVNALKADLIKLGHTQELREVRELGQGDCVKQLCEIVSDWNEFDVPHPGLISFCKVIGAWLNEYGGMDAMIEAYYAAKAVNRCASVVQTYWDGIGDWRW